MQFDDRLATVLRHRAAGARAARTQFRQLVDLLDRPREARDASLVAAAWLRLGALGGMVPARERAALLRDPSVRIGNPELAAHLAEDEPEVAAAALAKAKLSGDDWEALIPRLPIRARGFLRLRKDLPDRALAVLDRLGVHDRGLPEPVMLPEDAQQPPAGEVPPVEPEEAESPAPQPVPEDLEIGALVRRIEQFQRARSAAHTDSAAPRLPLGEADRPPLAQFAFTADGNGRIDWAEAPIAAAIVGTALTAQEGEIARLFARRQPLAGASIELHGAPAIAGAWTVEASPRFLPTGGQFAGYAGRFRRAAEVERPEIDDSAVAESARIRQLLHELRTPVNAIQGFAEVIQQQLFGPAPHEYRALAASIASDSARILAGFDELDRLSRLETGALEPEAGETDLTATVERTAAQLQGVLDPRMAGFDCELPGEPCLVALARDEGETLVWRLLATLAGAAGAGEQLRLSLACTGAEAILNADLPARLASEKDIFSATAKAPSGALSAGVFGAGFSLRLARAEAMAAGGTLARVDDSILFVLPVLTGGSALPSAGDEQAGEGEAG